MMKILFFHRFVFLLSFVFLLESCSRLHHQSLKRRHADDYSVAPQTMEYFLPVLPEWANYSTSAQCRRATYFRFLDLPRLRASLNFNYEEALQFQYSLNRKYSDLFKKVDEDMVLFKDEERIFYDVTEKIRGGRKDFKAPAYKRIFLIWIDPVLNSPEKLEKLKSFMQGPQIEEAPPLFISLCLSHDEMEKFIKDQGLQEQVLGFIPFELFSIYSDQNQPLSGTSLFLQSLFTKDQELHLFSPGKVVPWEFKGELQVHTY